MEVGRGGVGISLLTMTVLELSGVTLSEISGSGGSRISQTSGSQPQGEVAQTYYLAKFRLKNCVKMKIIFTKKERDHA